MNDVPIPLPEVDWEPTQGFWHAAARRVLAIPRCSDCERYTWYPAPVCRHCGHESLAWSPVSGRGTLFSYGVVRRALFKEYASKVPYVTGLVALSEDSAVRLVTLIVDCGIDDLVLDMPMHVVFKPLVFPEAGGEVLAPCFAPIGGPQ